MHSIEISIINARIQGLVAEIKELQALKVAKLNELARLEKIEKEPTRLIPYKTALESRKTADKVPAVTHEAKIIASLKTQPKVQARGLNPSIGKNAVEKKSNWQPKEIAKPANSIFTPESLKAAKPKPDQIVDEYDWEAEDLEIPETEEEYDKLYGVSEDDE